MTLLPSSELPEAPAPVQPARRVFFGPEGLRAGWGILTFILLFAVLSLATSFVIGKALHLPAHQAAPKNHLQEEITPSLLLGTEGASLIVLLLGTFAMSRIERRPFATYGLGGAKPIAHFLQGLVWGVLCLSALVFLLKTTGYLVFDARLLTAPSALRYALIWAAGFTLVAFLEENLLRGYLQYTLARGLSAIYGFLFHTRHRHALGFWTAALILSFAFGLGHGSNPGESPLGLVTAGLAGMVFCLALYRTGSLWWAMGAHASWDWAQSFLYGVADSGTMVQGHLFATHPAGRPILSGGLTGPEGSVFVLAALGLLAAIILRTLPQTKTLTLPPPHTASPADPALPA